MILLLKKYWREVTILALAIVAYISYKKEPQVIEITKTEYVDRVVEKVVTVEKEVVKDKKKRTTVQKPDGTKVVTETEENTKTKESKEETVVEKEEKQTEIHTRIETNHSYNLGLDAKLYPETEYSLSLKMRLGDLPIFIGPTAYVREGKPVQYGLGIGIQLEI